MTMLLMMRIRMIGSSLFHSFTVKVLFKSMPYKYWRSHDNISHLKRKKRLKKTLKVFQVLLLLPHPQSKRRQTGRGVLQPDYKQTWRQKRFWNLTRVLETKQGVCCLPLSLFSYYCLQRLQGLQSLEALFCLQKSKALRSFRTPCLAPRGAGVLYSAKPQKF